MPDYVSTVNPPKRTPDLSVRKKRDSLLWSAGLVVLIALADQVTKLLAVHHLSVRSSVEVLGDFFLLTLIYNEGGALGTNFGSPIYYLVTSLLILAFVFYYLYSNRNNFHFALPLACIAGGALGNIIDRIRLGKVVDFIDIDFFDIGFLHLERWWTFNIADAAISCSIVYLLIRVLFFSKHQPEEQSPQA
jgi:signal peptidase II